MKVLISTTTFADQDKTPLLLLRRNNLSYIFNSYKRAFTEEEVASALSKNSCVGLIAGTEPLTRNVLENAKSLKVISRVGAGLENIDMNNAKKLGIRVYNTPLVLIDSVAELTIGLIICCLRRISSLDKDMHNKTWKKEMGLLFKGKILGIVGFGKIGKRVAQLAKAFGAKVIFCDKRTMRRGSTTQVSLDKLLRVSDIISLHVSSKEELINKDKIFRMKEGVILINTSRGHVVSEDALYEALSSGRISSAGLDVYCKEPYNGKLLELNNVVCIPHVGSYAKEARVAMEIEAAENLIKGLKEEGLL